MKKIITYILPALLILLTGCDKYLDIVPVGQVIPGNGKEYRALLNTAYSAFPAHKEHLIMRGVQVLPVIDEYGLSGFPAYRNIYTWSDTSDSDGRTEEYKYDSFYKVIFYTNDIINNAPNAEESDGESLHQIIGEAYLLRAYCYFELANMYGPKYSDATRDTKVVPINLLIDTEQVLPRSTLGQIYDQIEKDVAEAEKLITVDTWSQPAEGYKISKVVLHAIASSIALYKGDWKKVISEVEKSLKVSRDLEDFNTSESLLPTQYTSKENIWALEEVVGFSIRDYSMIDPAFIAKYKDGDLRRTKYFAEQLDWMTGEPYTTSAKFTGRNTRSSIRRAELFLNAAEAAARLGQADIARKYMNELLSKRYTSTALTWVQAELNGLSGEALVSWIFEERLKELAVEGHEWYDYKRTTQPALSKVIEGKTFTLKQGDARYVLQIPQSARKANPKLSE